MPAPKGNQYAKGNRGGPGRPTLYRPNYHPRKVFELFHLRDMTCEKAAKIFDISLETFYVWLDKHEEFFTQYREARDFIDSKVAVSLREAAMGHRKNTEKIFHDKDAICPNCDGLGKVGPRGNKTKCVECGGTGRGRVVRVKTKTYFPPDVGAAKFHLMNRQGYKNTKAVEWDGSVTINEDGDSIDVDMLSPETREMILRDIEAASRAASETSQREASGASEGNEKHGARSETKTRPRKKLPK